MAKEREDGTLSKKAYDSVCSKLGILAPTAAAVYKNLSWNTVLNYSLGGPAPREENEAEEIRVRKKDLTDLKIRALELTETNRLLEKELERRKRNVRANHKFVQLLYEDYDQHVGDLKAKLEEAKKKSCADIKAKLLESYHEKTPKCCICLEVGKILVLLRPCNHQYCCAQCLSKLDNAVLCPVCRTVVSDVIVPYCCYDG